MSYRIDSLPIPYVLGMEIGLPRFQRKDTWNEVQRFELCISVFQDYPVGVIILNQKKGTNLLLDGRQRLKTLKDLQENPLQVYDWARRYIQFKAKTDTDTIVKEYWKKVNKYLENGTAAPKKSKSDSSEENVDVYGGDEGQDDYDYDYDYSFNKDDQKRGLTTLLELVLMVHQIEKKRSHWERLFDFKEYFPKLHYIRKNQFMPNELRKELLDYHKSCKGDLTPDSFVSYFMDEYFELEGKDLTSFSDRVYQHWDEIKKSIKTINDADTILANSYIGIIFLQNADVLDAQNIFSRINQGGTPLKPEELLSAKPFWNEPVSVSDKKTKQLIDEMYEKLGVNKNDQYVKWDLAATIVSRIDKNHLFFSPEQEKEETEISLERISTGFKLISSTLGNGGMSAKSVIDLESSKIDWESDIDDLVSEINGMCSVLLTIPFFKALVAWKKPIIELLGKAITLELVTILRKSWKDLNEPDQTAATNYEAFRRNAMVLFDRLVYEYETSLWSGSGDSRMANDIKNWDKRFVKVSQDDWLDYLKEAYLGTYKEKEIAIKVLRPVLYYYYCLKGMVPLNEVDTTFDVDHILPQAKLKDNDSIKPFTKDCLINLALLPKKTNISKGADFLKATLSDEWLSKNIAIYSEIPIERFDEFSSVAKIKDLHLLRSELFSDAFKQTRDNQLS